MHLDELAFVLALEGGPGGSVGFVADNQIEVGQSMLPLGGMMTSMLW